MNLLLVTQDFPPGEGGMARYYGDLAAGLGSEVIVSTVMAEGPAAPPASGLRIERMDVPFRGAHRPLALWRWERRLAGRIRAERIDAIVCGNLRPLGPLCRRLAARFGIPFLVIFHGNDLLSAHRRWRGWRRPVWNHVFGGDTRWLANSRAVESLAVDRCGLEAARGGVLRPEVDTARFRPAMPREMETLRGTFGLPAGPLALFVGRLVERKGLDRLITALAGSPEGTLAVAGYGDPAPYRALAESHGVGGRVRFLGAVDDAHLPELYRAADCLVMPARTRLDRDDIEGFGIVYLEAAASGLPALAGRSGGAPEAVLDGETGIVVDGDDETAVARALAGFFAAVKTPGGWPCRYGAAGRRRVEAEFGTGSMARVLRRRLSGQG